MAERGPRFLVWETDEELKKLDESIKTLGYKDRSEWYRDMKRYTIEKAENKKEPRN